MPAAAPALLAARLDSTQTPWRIDRRLDQHLELINIALARTPNAPGLPFSFAALPGHYLAGLAQQALNWQKQRCLLLLNPAWHLPRQLLSAFLADWHDQHDLHQAAGQLLGPLAQLSQRQHFVGSDQKPLSQENRSALAAPGSQVVIVLDAEQNIVAYLLGPNWLNHFPTAVLHDLSGFCAASDAALLRAAGVQVAMHRLRLPSQQTYRYAIDSFPTVQGFAIHVAQARTRALMANKANNAAATKNATTSPAAGNAVATEAASTSSAANNAVATTATLTSSAASKPVPSQAPARVGGPTWGVLTHHAGDIYLALQVILRNPACVDGLLVHRSYIPIVEAVLPSLPYHAIDGPQPARGFARSRAHPLQDELLYFESYVLPQLPPNVGLRLLRPVRGYKDAPLTLLAQFAAVLAGPGAAAAWPTGRVFLPDPSLLPALVSADGPKFRPLNNKHLPPLKGRRVLLHFDGGWPLKLISEQAQHDLLRGLQQLGCTVSVLGSAGAQAAARFDGVQWHTFTSVNALQQLISEHDLLIGMDSFPAHLASFSTNTPVLCLFGPTSQSHLAHTRPHYLATSRQLACSPCDAYKICPRYGGTNCHNFASVDTILSLVSSRLPLKGPETQ